VAAALGVLGVVLSISLMEGVWTWLLAAGISEIAGQVHPPVAAIGLVLMAGWVAARLTDMAHLSVERRRWLLVGGGLALCLIAGTVHAGLLHPLQLFFGHQEPDYRGAGVLVVLLTAYLWGRGLALAPRVNRARVLNHIGISASGLVAVLVFLPLVDVVQWAGLGAVLACFLLAIAALLLDQLSGVESRQLTRLQWASIAAASAILLVLGGAVLAGFFSSGALGVVGGAAGQLGRYALPVTDAMLLGAGYLAHYLALFFVWVGELFGADAEAITRAMEAAEETRPRFEQEATPAPPEFLTLFVTLSLTLIFALIAISIFYRLAGRIGRRRDDDVREQRDSAAGGGLLELLRGIRHGIGNIRGEEARIPGDPRSAIRYHYRAFQTLLARAGLPRSAAQTALEYKESLRQPIPGASEPIATLSDAYIVARYAGPDVPLPDPGPAGESVMRVRDSLREQDSGR
jgi:hypothetical protein